MGPQNSKNDDGDVSTDVLDYRTGKGPSEPSCSSSIPCKPEPVPDEPQFSPSRPPLATTSPATTIRSRPVCRGSWDEESADSGFTASICSDNDLTNIRIMSCKKQNVVARPVSTRGRCGSFPASCSAREETNQESMVTTAANDDSASDSSYAVANPPHPSSNLFQLIARFAFNSIGFPISFFVRFITLPMWFLYHSFMFYIDPFRKFRAGKMVILWISPRVWGIFWERVSPSLYRWLKDRISIWKIGLRCGWGILWLIYVFISLLVLLVSSLVISGFMMKYISEKPIQKTEILNFDYTKESPIAYVPLISCPSVGAGNDWDNIADNRRTSERVIPSKRKVQVMLSLLVPESEYNKNLGVFQVRIDSLSFNGKIIASSSMPLMLRFRSGLIRQMLSVLKLAHLVSGHISEAQTLNVKMEDFIERDEPTACLKVTLEQRASVQAGSGIPELYGAHLVLDSKPPFLKWITWRWKKTVFIWITTMTFMMELLVALVCCRPMIIPMKRQRG
ncbi:seipin-2-like [Prosopis cineraria]|uniref:seipin-2-like n=1 Tax=Prosopis cineraria TaxID=364024 RepID=UPI00241098E4|nr:seipin-2-like [Prosopis cineraria]